MTTEQMMCVRCGRSSHQVEKCFAKAVHGLPTDASISREEFEKDTPEKRQRFLEFETLMKQRPCVVELLQQDGSDLKRMKRYTEQQVVMPGPELMLEASKVHTLHTVMRIFGFPWPQLDTCLLDVNVHRVSPYLCLRTHVRAQLEQLANLPSPLPPDDFECVAWLRKCLKVHNGLRLTEFKRVRTKVNGVPVPRVFMLDSKTVQSYLHRFQQRNPAQLPAPQALLEFYMSIPWQQPFQCWNQLIRPFILAFSPHYLLSLAKLVGSGVVIANGLSSVVNERFSASEFHTICYNYCPQGILLEFPHADPPTFLYSQYELFWRLQLRNDAIDCIQVASARDACKDLLFSGGQLWLSPQLQHHFSLKRADTTVVDLARLFFQQNNS